MKLKFKKQQYQEDASLSVVKCFEGQPKAIRQDLIGRREKKIGMRVQLKILFLLVIIE